MNIKLYKMSCEDNRIDKTSFLTYVLEYEGSLRTETSLLNPQIDIQHGGKSDFTQFNYAYIEDFNRYYFIDDITSVRTYISRLHLRCDVLMSYVHSIGQLPCIVARTSNEEYVSKELYDNQIPLLPTIDTEIVYNEQLRGDFINNIGGAGTATDLCFVVTMVQPLDIEAARGSWLGNLLSVPSANLSGNTPFSCCFVLSHEKLQSLADAVLKNSEAASYIISIRSMPLDAINFTTTLLSGDMKYYDSEGNEHVLLEHVQYIPNVVNDNAVNTTSYVVKAHQKIEVTRKYNDYRDYAPFTTFEMFLPYYGNYQLKENDIYNGLYYDVMLNFTTGQLTYGFYRDKGEGTVRAPSVEYIETINVTLGIEIPISATNYQEIIRSNESKMISGVGGLVASVISVVAGIALMATGAGAGLGASLAIGGAAGGVTAGTSMAANFESIPNVSATGSKSNNTVGIYLPTNMMLVRRTKNCTEAPANISSVLGLPSMKWIEHISDLGSNIILYVYDCHLDGITALKTEKDEIYRLLRSGVIT